MDDGPGFDDEPDYEQFGEENDEDQNQDDQQIAGHIKVQTRILQNENEDAEELQNKLKSLNDGSSSKKLQDWEYG